MTNRLPRAGNQKRGKYEPPRLDCSVVVCTNSVDPDDELAQVLSVA